MGKVFKGMGWGAMLAAALVAGCGNVESEFKEALNKSDSRNICVDFGELGLSGYNSNGKIYLAQNTGWLKSDVQILAELQEKGYVSKDPYMLQASRWAPQVNGFELTKKGSKWFQEGKPVCVGEREVTEIIDFTEPTEGGPAKVSQANFKYEVEFNDLVADLGIEDALLAQMDKNPLRQLDGTGQATFVKTNKGWRPELVLW
jgi:hypothetical protein